MPEAGLQGWKGRAQAGGRGTSGGGGRVCCTLPASNVPSRVIGGGASPCNGCKRCRLELYSPVLRWAAGHGGTRRWLGSNTELTTRGDPAEHSRGEGRQASSGICVVQADRGRRWSREVEHSLPPLSQVWQGASRRMTRGQPM